jgi:K+-transporting ATPase ATPase C chain
MAHNPGVAKSEIPADMVTASGSGLDPHISPQSAYIQVARVAKVRGLTQTNVKTLVEKHVEKGMLGPDVVNVLQLNVDLDEMK